MKENYSPIRKSCFATLPTLLFTGSISFLLVCTIVLSLFDHGSAFFSMLHPDTNDTFMDFFNSINDALAADPYTERKVIYPPLIYLFYRFCGIFMPQTSTAAQAWKQSQPGIILAVLYTVFLVLILWRLIQSCCAHRHLSYLPGLLLLGTLPFWYAYERGNSIVIALVFLMLFLQLYRSPVKYKRELAYLCLAISAAVKIYPALFGVLLLRERRWKDALHCIFYGAFFFFFPFVWLGGFSNIVTFLSNATATSGRMAQRGFGYKVNLSNWISFSAEATGFSLSSTAALLIFVVFLGAILLFSKKEWQVYMALSSALVLLPGFSFSYTLIYLLPPLLAFLTEKHHTRLWLNCIYAVLFVGVFGFFPFGGAKLFVHEPEYKYNMNLTTLVENIALISLVFIIFLEVIFDFLLAHSKRFCNVAQKIRLNQFTSAALACLVIAIIILFSTLVYARSNRVYKQEYYFTPIQQFILENPGCDPARIYYLTGECQLQAEHFGHEPTAFENNLHGKISSAQITNFFSNLDYAFVLDETIESNLMEVYGSNDFSVLILSRFESRGIIGGYELFVLR